MTDNELDKLVDVDSIVQGDSFNVALQASATVIQLAKQTIQQHKAEITEALDLMVKYGSSHLYVDPELPLWARAYLIFRNDGEVLADSKGEIDYHL